jgi:uncharacterized protein (TIGR03032 family)
MHQGHLWALNSGTGHMVKVDQHQVNLEPVAFCPGYLHVLSFVGEHFAVVTLSRPRHDQSFGSLELDEALGRHRETAQCDLPVIDLRNGRIARWIRLEADVSELYDVVALPGVVRPMAFGTKTNDIERIISLGDPEQV